MLLAQCHITIVLSSLTKDPSFLETLLALSHASDLFWQEASEQKFQTHQLVVLSDPNREPLWWAEVISTYLENTGA